MSAAEESKFDSAEATAWRGLTTWKQVTHPARVTIKQLREHLEARPFRPIVVRTVSGTRHAVKHPDYLLIPPVGDTVLIVESNGTMHHIGVSHIEAVETEPKAGRSK